METLYETSLIFLYRVLFILYAEGRNLLPVKGYGSKQSPLYRKHYSLTFLTDELMNGILPRHEVIFHDRMQRLFKLIEGKKKDLNEELKVPQYDGGLFEVVFHPEIAKWVIEDRFLIRVLRGLLFIEKHAVKGKTLPISDKMPIDYSILEVRQLGSIYEGLLEYHLEIDQNQNCVVIKQDNVKRKSTGSYYTPDPIVRYIVEETLTPHLTQISQLPSVVNGEPNSFAAEVLKLKVLDPAMGSGHFLVRATEFLAEQIINHATTDVVGDHEEQKALWRRRVVESCIYGVDLNPLAVELAKLSLWLTCISSDRPLNFLDHHLRCGNSLVGAKNEDMGILARKGETIHVLSKIEGLDEKLTQAKAALKEITGADASDLLGAERKKQVWDKDVHKLLAPFRAIADLRTSMEFGLNLHPDEYKEIVLALMSAEPDKNCVVALPNSLLEKYGAVWDSHLANVAQYRPFHWELEFPDVFVRESEQAGFDAVIGNPPYGFHKIHVPQLKDYFRNHNEAAQGSFENYFLFYAKSLELLKPVGWHSFIVPVTWLTIPSARKLREYVLGRFSLRRIIWLSSQMFESAQVNNIITIISKVKSNDISIGIYEGMDDLQNRDNLIVNNIEDIVDSKFYISIFTSLKDQKILDTIYSCSQSLGDIARPCSGYNPYEIGAGIAPDGQPHSAETIRKKPYHSNEQIDPSWKMEVGGKNIHRYQVELDLKRWVKYGKWLSAPRESSTFIGKRLLVQEITGGKDKRICAALYEKELYHSRDVIAVKILNEPPMAEFILGIVNSKLISWVHSKSNPKAKKALFPKVPVSDLSRLPIRRIDMTINAQKILHDQLVKLVKRIIELCEDVNLLTMDVEKVKYITEIREVDHQIDSLVYQLYGLTDEEIAIVEGRAEGD